MLGFIIQNFIISLCFFLFDISSAAFIGYPWLHSLTMLIIVLLFLKIPHFFFYFPFLFLGLESFVFYNRYALEWVYLIPTLLCMKWVRERIPYSILEIILFSFIVIVIRYTIFAFFVLNHPPFALCTFTMIGANLLVAYFSLKWLPTVKRGNRF